MRVRVASPPPKAGPARGALLRCVAALSALLWSGASAAQSAQTGLSVGATVVPSCTLSTNGPSGPAAVSCRNLGTNGYRVERGDAVIVAGSAGAPVASPGAKTLVSDAVAYVTITY